MGLVSHFFSSPKVEPSAVMLIRFLPSSYSVFFFFFFPRR